MAHDSSTTSGYAEKRVQRYELFHYWQKNVEKKWLFFWKMLKKLYLCN